MGLVAWRLDLRLFEFDRKNFSSTSWEVDGFGEIRELQGSKFERGLKGMSLPVF